MHAFVLLYAVVKVCVEYTHDLQTLSSSSFGTLTVLVIGDNCAHKDIFRRISVLEKRDLTGRHAHHRAAWRIDLAMCLSHDNIAHFIDVHIIRQLGVSVFFKRDHRLHHSTSVQENPHRLPPKIK